MSAVAVEPRYTPEDLLTMGEEGRYELVNGQLVERTMGMKSDFVAMRVGKIIGIFAEDHDLGYVFGAQGGYQIFDTDSSRVRYPDCSFISKTRMSIDEMPDGHSRIVPDLVVESISPNEKVYELQLKLADYKAAGIPLIWIFYPETRVVEVIKNGGPTNQLGEADELSGEDVLPGFRCSVREFFEGLPTGVS